MQDSDFYREYKISCSQFLIAGTPYNKRRDTRHTSDTPPFRLLPRQRRHCVRVNGRTMINRSSVTDIGLSLLARDYQERTAEE